MSCLVYPFLGTRVALFRSSFSHGSLSSSRFQTLCRFRPQHVRRALPLMQPTRALHSPPSRQPLTRGTVASPLKAFEVRHYPSVARTSHMQYQCSSPASLPRPCGFLLGRPAPGRGGCRDVGPRPTLSAMLKRREIQRKSRHQELPFLRGALLARLRRRFARPLLRRHHTNGLRPQTQASVALRHPSGRSNMLHVV